MWGTISNVHRVFLICALYLTCVNCFVKKEARTKSEVINKNNTRQPLIVTPLINEGKITEARVAAEVKFDEFKDIKSYSGYLTVSSHYNSNLFFWFFPSQKNYEKAPVILWLQGGPGASSLFGLFTENGPFELIPEENCSLKFRTHSWSAEHSVLYIDNPVGTGYSFTNADGYARNQTIIGAHLYEALLQFFQLFPELQKNDFFVTGESYGGKYVPAVSHAIHLNNPTARQKINLQGLAMGNGWCDPEHQMVYGDYLYQLGLVDSNTNAKMQDIANQCLEYIQQKQWLDASRSTDAIINKFQEVTGFENYFNYLLPKDTSGIEKCLHRYLEREDVMAAIHVGNVNFNDDSVPVALNLVEDQAKSVAPWISTLLGHYRTLFYNGQLDIIVAYPLTVNFLKNLNFNEADAYKSAVRHKWYVGKELAGYVKQAGNLTEVLVRNAGHMVPSDQPRWALDLITRFVRIKPLY